MRMMAMILGVVLLAMPAKAAELKIATWNIEHLRAEDDAGPNPRMQEDFDRLARYAQLLNADVVALQEVDGAEAASRVFDPNAYAFFFSERNNAQRTGFAVRKAFTVSQNPDFTALNVTGGLRHGTDITVGFGTQQIRFLALHLKSGCFDDPIGATNDACEKLNRQIPHLEEWIDDRAREKTPFVVLGDWNRRFSAPGDRFWPQLDDSDPPNADLVRVTEGWESLCWDGEFPEFIDHIVLDRSAAAWVTPASFQQIVYEEDEGLKDKLSDHCPIAVTLDTSDEEASSAKARILEKIQSIQSELRTLRLDIEALP